MAEHARKPGRYRVRLVDGRQWLVDADAVTSTAAFKEGVELDEAAVLRLEDSHRFTGCFDRALGMLARARRTRRELEQRLRKAEQDPRFVAQAIIRLEQLGLLNDEDVARAEAASRFRRGEGAGRIRQSLMRKGVSGAIVDAAVRDVAQEEQIDDEALCRSAGEKRMRSLASHPADVQRRRLTGFLLRRGFPSRIVGDVVRALVPRNRRGDE
ncbi:MAG: regulatory protein RecX [Phycisphaerae bacterium]|nr:regulatory protein RecX [Phycisphaerae bacterium]